MSHHWQDGGRSNIVNPRSVTNRHSILSFAYDQSVEKYNPSFNRSSIINDSQRNIGSRNATRAEIVTCCSQSVKRHRLLNVRYKSKSYSFIWLQKLCSSGWSPKEDVGSALPLVCAHIIGQNIIIRRTTRRTIRILIPRTQRPKPTRRPAFKAKTLRCIRCLRSKRRSRGSHRRRITALLNRNPQILEIGAFCRWIGICYRG
ncbi:hypothetical protein BKA64DRAFT_209466 [Cadophora sp. MPI-SDFR-AT-0126]|nr:hypothetical protein BKA64DRAFT_209466 [Leotiomycetes sp. MPI-SDFR-AT-0126]